jgi:hypothetical protein
MRWPGLISLVESGWRGCVGGWLIGPGFKGRIVVRGSGHGNRARSLKTAVSHVRRMVIIIHCGANYLSQDRVL